MNIIVFYIRVFLGAVSVIISLGEFSQGKKTAAIITLAVALVVIWPVVNLLYRRQKALPVSALKNDFGIERTMAWLRFFFGYVIAMGFSDKITIQETGKIACIAMGMFLTLPISAKVFSYTLAFDGKKTIPDTGTFGLIFIRLYAVFSILIGLDPLDDKSHPGYRYFWVITGVILVFIRQITLVLTGKKGVVPLWSTWRVPVTGQGIPATLAAAVDQRIPVAAVKQPSPEALQKLAADYKNLLQLEPAQKPKAFQQFLHTLFSIYDFSIVSNFLLQGEHITGSIEMDGQVYILAARCQFEKNDHEDLLIFNGQVEAKSTWARGIFISTAGFTKDGLETFARGKRTSIIGMDGQDLKLILDGRISLPEAIKRKARRAVETNLSFVPLQKLV